jgi:iron complex transport system substrate-binding protein
MIHHLSYNLYPLLVIATLIAGSCKQHPNPEENTYSVTDMLNRKVAVPDTIDQIIGIGPGTVRLITYLKATNMIAGIEEVERRSGRPYILAYPQLKKRPIIGPQFTGNAELIAAQSPDIIFKSYTTKSEADDLSRKTQIPVVCITPENISGEWKHLTQSLRLMGDILGKTTEAQSLIRYYSHTKAKLDSLTQGIPLSEKPEVYIGGISFKGTHGITSTSPEYNPFRLIHAHNVATNLSDEHAMGQNLMIDIEQLIQWNPDMMFLDVAGLSVIKQDIADHKQALAHIQAFRDSAVYSVHPYNWYSTNYATVLANTWYIASVLYPETFHTDSLTHQINTIYTHFLGKPVYKKMCKIYGPYRKLSFRDMYK